MIIVGPVDPSPLGDGFDESAFPGAPLAGHLVAVTGDQVDKAEDDTYLRGRGTIVSTSETLTATVCGTVERVNKLVTVKAVSGRYLAQAGDVIVGRVTEIHGKRWTIDIGALQEAVLMLSSVTIPGVQRRHTAEDELSMREILKEGDLLSAEVQTMFHDASISLQTRTSRFGRLREGQLLTVQPALMKRLKQHITRVPETGVEVVLGVNGLVWLGPKREPGDEAPATSEEREQVAACAMAVRVLDKCNVMIHPGSIQRVVDAARHGHVPAKDMLSSQFLQRVLAEEAMRQNDETVK